MEPERSVADEHQAVDIALRGFTTRREKDMDKLVVVVFDDEKRAYEGSTALRALHDEGSITLYADAVITKDPDGKVSLRRARDPGPEGAVSGLLIGSLVGLLGGPVGLAVGAGTGTLTGGAIDLTRAGIGDDFVHEVSDSLLPGKSAVVAEIEEEWQTPLDLRMEALGGQVTRRHPLEFKDVYLEKEVAAYRAELDTLEAELDKASAERRARLQARVREVRRKLRAKQDRLKAHIDSVKQEGEARLKSLQQRMATAGADRKEELNKRVENVRAEYKERAGKLEEAWELAKSALEP
jgi:uncharacterized membrane protein